ncbi:cell adhesion molecule CEACAM5-like isoform X2 [Mobula birostris]|uniref:cell adhesion molecule CEACAM5-like isoform X2 n=1 Tax=Mobula birostris TaxID=1983395 RepID=UPI003B28C328
MAVLPFAALVLCFFILAGESQQFTITVENRQINASIGSDAHFSVQPSSNVSSGGWTVNGTLVVRWIYQTVSFGNEYTSRAVLMTSSGSLLLKSVKMMDSGEYRVNMVPASGLQSSATITLKVFDGPESLRVSISSEFTFYPVGSNVTFLCSAVSNPAAQFQWIRDYSTLRISGYQLSIADLSLNHTGNYTCNASNLITQEYAVATRLIVVLEPVSKPAITSNNSEPVEHNDTVSLTCTANGTDVSYLWFMNNKTVSSGGRISLSSNNSSLTISGVLRSDEEFTCSAYNMVNMNTSDPYRLNIQYGPENLTIYINPELPVYETGSNANFSCSAVSNPAPEIFWYFNGSSVQHNGHRLILVNLSLSDTGIYACEAFNDVTRRSSSTTRNFVVLEPVSNVNVTSNATHLIEYNDTVSLTCFANGTAVSYVWLKENSPVTPDGRFKLSADKSTLTIAGVLRTDGLFTCRASNSINSLTSNPFNLTVYYGPDRPSITTKSTSNAYIAGSNITLTCSAVSHPDANLTWHFSGDLLQTGQEFILANISMNETGNYTCQAYNNITRRFSASTQEINVLEHPEPTPGSSSGLSAGAIVGIVIAVIAVVALVALILWIIKKKASRLNAGIDKSDPKTTSPENKPTPSSNGTNAAPAQAKDGYVIYTRPNIINAGAKPTNEPVIDNRTDYAEVKYR